MMKKYRLIYWITFLIFIAACNSDVDDLQPQHIYGTWQASYPSEGSQPILVHTYTFNSDGTYEESKTYRQSDYSEDLGYTSFAKGNYTLIDNKIDLQSTVFYVLPLDDEVLYRNLDELIIEDYGSKATLYVSLKKRNSKLVIGYVCPPNAACAPARTYYKVN